MEHGVRVDVDQIVKVLGVLTGHDVARPVRIGEGVQKRLQRSLQQLYEWILGGVFATAAQYGMFENVRHAGRVGGGGAEGNPEALVGVVGRGEGEQLRAGLGVTIEGGMGAEFGYDIGLQNGVGWMFDRWNGVGECGGSCSFLFERAPECRGGGTG